MKFIYKFNSHLNQNFEIGRYIIQIGIHQNNELDYCLCSKLSCIHLHLDNSNKIWNKVAIPNGIHHYFRVFFVKRTVEIIRTRYAACLIDTVYIGVLYFKCPEYMLCILCVKLAALRIRILRTNTYISWFPQYKIHSTEQTENNSR